MATIYPFRALRPAAGLAAKVAAVPYDVVDRQEAAALAQGVPESFLRVTRPEIDLSPAADPHSEAVYQHGAATLRALHQEGVLRRDDQPALYIYSITMQGHTQTGVVCLASIAEYNSGLVKKHEHTRPDKEDDRVRHMQILGAQSGTVFLVHRPSPAIGSAVQECIGSTPWADFRSSDGIRHRLWSVLDSDVVDRLVQAFAAHGPLYIADGHHRSAAAARVKAQGLAPAESAEPAADDGFLAVSFPSDEVQILPYNRVIADLNGLTVERFLELLESGFTPQLGKAETLERHGCNLYVDGRWFTLHADLEALAIGPALVDRLDVAILQQHVLQPILGIEDPRRDTRIAFVGGIRGDEQLEHRVDASGGCAFAMHATSIDELLDVADAGLVMPPKSTWFEPKLRDGLFVHLLR